MIMLGFFHLNCAFLCAINFVNRLSLSVNHYNKAVKAKKKKKIGENSRKKMICD